MSKQNEETNHQGVRLEDAFPETREEVAHDITEEEATERKRIRDNELLEEERRERERLAMVEQDELLEEDDTFEDEEDEDFDLPEDDTPKPMEWDRALHDALMGAMRTANPTRIFTAKEVEKINEIVDRFRHRIHVGAISGIMLRSEEDIQAAMAEAMGGVRESIARQLTNDALGQEDDVAAHTALSIARAIRTGRL